MTTVLIVDKDGLVKESRIKNYDDELLFKKVGLKSTNDFKLQHTYQILLGEETHSVSVFGKTSGKSTYINKYEFPPPIDEILFYGSCILVRKCTKTNDITLDLTVDLWNDLYSELFGGFHDIDNSEDDEDSDNDSISIDPILLTKEGYLKDDFITEDSEPSVDGDVSSDDETAVTKPIKRAKKSVVDTNTKIKQSKIKKVSKKVVDKEECKTYLDCASELTAEEYFK